MKIYCTGCTSDVDARLTNGEEIYPHRRDLYNLPFWRCDTCHNYVGCHHKTKNRTNPLGCIPTPSIKQTRWLIHQLIDPIWKSRKMSRHDVYKHMSDALGWNYHTAKIRSDDEADKAYQAAWELQALLQVTIVVEDE